MLRDRDWIDVATFCAYHRQCGDLELKPWESAPCWLGTEDDLDAIIAAGAQYNYGKDVVAATMLKQMLAADLSKYDPTPRESIAAASKWPRIGSAEIRDIR